MPLHPVSHSKEIREQWSGAWRLLTPENPHHVNGTGHGRVLLGTLRDLVQVMDDAGVPDEAEMVFRDDKQCGVRGVVDIAIVYGTRTDLMNGEEIPDAADEG